MNLSALFAHRNGPQTNGRRCRVTARLQAELVAVPRAHDARIGLVELESRRLVPLVEHFDDPRNEKALTHRSTLVRAPVLVRVQPSLDTKDADRQAPDVDDEPAAIGHLLTRSHSVRCAHELPW